MHQVGELITVLFLLGDTFRWKSDGATDLQTLFKYLVQECDKVQIWKKLGKIVTFFAPIHNYDLW